MCRSPERFKLATGDRRWLHADERGSVTAISNASGNAITINSYDDYGMPATGNIGKFGLGNLAQMNDQLARFGPMSCQTNHDIHASEQSA